MKYIISLKLRDTSSDAIRSVLYPLVSDYINLQPGLWIVVTEKSALEIRDSIFKVITKKDRLFIGGLTGSYDGLFDAPDSDYLQMRIFDR